jgi:hypothetical protein
MAKSAKQTAWMLDESVAVAEEGGHIPGVPGLWRPGEAVSPEAFGMGVGEFRDLVSSLSLPLVEVSVGDGKALTAFDRPLDDPNRFPSEPESAAFGTASVDLPADEVAAEFAPPVVPIEEVEE